MAIKFFNDVAVDSSVLYVDTVNDRVGIGTTSPGEKLAVAGNIALASNDSFISFNTSGSSGDPKIKMNSDADFSFLNTAGSTNLHIENGGNVGIGTTNPSRELDVYGNIQLSDPTYSSVRGLYGPNGPLITFNGFNFDTLVAGGTIRYNPVAQEVNLTVGGTDEFLRHSRQGGYTTFTNNNSERMRITSSGNVGIGTTSPLTKLHTDFGTLTNGDVNELVLQSKADGSTYYSSSAITGITFTNWINGYTAGTLNRAAGIYGYNADTAERFGRYMGLSFYTSSLDASATEKMRIDHSGNVGIGTINPSADAKLVIHNADVDLEFSLDSAVANTARILSYDRVANAHRDLQLRGNQLTFYTGTSEKMRIASNGNVGIGTTGPGYKLEVSNSDTTQTTLDSLTFRAVSTAYAGTVGVFENTSGINTSIRISDTVDDMYIVSRNGIMGLGPSGGWSSTNLNITSLGLVGIGARNPLDRLHVNGSARVQNGRVKFYEGTTVNRGHVGPNGSLLEIASTYKTIFKTGPTLTEKMRLTDDGRLLLNTPDNASASDARFEMIGTAADATTNFTFKYNGKLGLGDYTPVAKITVVGTTNNVTSNLVQIKNTSNTGSVIDFRNSLNGQAGLISMPTSTTVNYGTTSDHRLKTNVVGLENGIDKVKKLKPSRFEWINDGIVVDGFIAHEVKEVVPEAVTGKKDAVDKDNNPVYQTIDHSKIIPVLTAALQEAIEKIEQLETRIQTLENK